MDWNVIKTEYITTNISYRKLAEKYGVPFDTLRHRAKEEEWVNARTQHNHNMVSKMVKNAEKKAVNYRSALYDLAYKVALQLNELTDRNTVADLAVMGLKPRDITGAIKDLEDALHVKSEAELREQEARIAKLRREAEEDKKAEEGITVIISGGAEEYSE